MKPKRAWSPTLAEDEIQRGFRGWHENGYLPHRDEPGLIQFVTFRLADAFPTELRSEWEALLKIEGDRKRRIELETGNVAGSRVHADLSNNRRWTEFLAVLCCVEAAVGLMFGFSV